MWALLFGEHPQPGLAVTRGLGGQRQHKSLPVGVGGGASPGGAGPRCAHHHSSTSITPGHRCGNLPGGLAEEPKRDGKRAGRPSGDSQAWAGRREAPLTVRRIQKPRDSVNRHLPVQTPCGGRKLEEGLEGLCFSRGAKQCPHMSVQPGEPVGVAGAADTEEKASWRGEFGAGL